MHIIYLINGLYVIIIFILAGIGMIEGIWALVVAGVTISGTLVSIWLQGRKDSVRIKDVDDKTSKVEPTYNNTEKLLNKVDDNFKQVNENFKNADLRKVTEYVIVCKSTHDALQQAAKNTNFDYNLFVSQMQATLKTIEGLNRRIAELEYQNELLQNQLEAANSKNLENEEELETNAFSRDDELEM